MCLYISGINETRLVQRLGGGSNVVLSYYISNNVSAWDANSSLLADGDQWHLGMFLILSQCKKSFGLCIDIYWHGSCHTHES